MEETLVGLIMEDPAMLHFLDKRLNILLHITERTLDAAKGAIDFLWLGEDLGTQHAPIISLDLYRKILKPRHQKFVNLAKSFNIPVMIHTCGSSSWVYEDFIEMGINVVDTLQPEAHNMSPEYLQKTFAKRLSFHGCISTAEPLSNGSVDEVDRYCRNTLNIMMQDGAYCFAPTHMIQDNSPLENVLAMYAACDKYGGYSD